MTYDETPNEPPQQPVQQQPPPPLQQQAVEPNAAAAGATAVASSASYPAPSSPRRPLSSASTPAHRYRHSHNAALIRGNFTALPRPHSADSYGGGGGGVLPSPGLPEVDSSQEETDDSGLDVDRDDPDPSTSDNPDSERVGTGTDFTSLMEEQPDSVGHADVIAELEPDDEGEAASLYTASAYPRVPSVHRVERPYDSATVTSSRSLWEGDLDYVVEHGRRYCGDYYMPNDELEQDRLRILHQVFLHIFDRELTSVPLSDPTNVLDIGTGTGEWAIAMGERFPECEVVGTDISAIQPGAVPHNVYFEVDNAELEWTREPDTYDLIHLRNMVGALADWPFVYSQAFTCLKPGGHVELVEFDERGGFRPFYASLPPDSPAMRLVRDTFAASLRAGRPRGIAHMEQRLLLDAGFVDVRQEEYNIPLSPSEMPCGKLWLIACLAGIEAITLRLVTTHMGWPGDEAKAAAEQLTRELKSLAMDPDRARDFVVKVRVLTGRKPDVPGQESAQDIGADGAINHGLRKEAYDYSTEESSEDDEEMDDAVPVPEEQGREGERPEVERPVHAQQDDGRKLPRRPLSSQPAPRQTEALTVQTGEDVKMVDAPPSPSRSKTPARSRAGTASPTSPRSGKRVKP